MDERRDYQFTPIDADNCDEGWEITAGCGLTNLEVSNKTS
jgi:hypothetical protein